MIQEILAGILVLLAVIYLAYRFFPSVFGIRKTTSGCSSCHPDTLLKSEKKK